MFNLFKNVAEQFTPVLNESQFYKSGVCTPDEFLEAGNMLISKCADWQWMGGNSSTNKSYLPDNKQYLCTKGVPSLRRVAAYTLDGDTTVDDEQGDDWLVTHTNIDVAAANKMANNVASTPKDVVDDDDCPDLDDFDYGEMGEATAPAADFDDDIEIIATTSSLRTYDVSIVYDKYYRTPRVFLTGYSADGRLLTADEVQQDVSSDHAHKTVTIETHPYTSLPCLSIHPCQHAHTMKRMLDVMIGEEERMVRAQNEIVKARVNADKAKKQGDKEVFAHLKGTGVESNVEEEKVLTEEEISNMAMENVKTKFPASKYMLLFLKFIATVVPTIDYDQTAALELF